jgi:hypothetical protein
MISTRARHKITKATRGLESHITALTCNDARFQKEWASVKNTRGRTPIRRLGFDSLASHGLVSVRGHHG